MNFNNINIQDLQLDHAVEINPLTGAAAIDVNIPLPEGRSGFNPSLSLQYSSSSSNSIFGRGWNVNGISFITIDTKEGLPKYDGTDNYAFSGTNTLVPQLQKTGGKWEKRIEEATDHWIYYYRPKFEDAFIRFEKWIHKTSGEIHWRTRSPNNIISVYGLDASGSTKIYDPENDSKVFLWLLETQYDENGNAVHYTYKTENPDNIDPLASYETGRIKTFNAKGFAQKYPERIRYGNTQPMLPDTSVPANNKWLFEVVFDYGDYANRPYTSNQPHKALKWYKRPDPFSAYTSGFEIRTYRLCKRILTYHHFDELAITASLTGIFECEFNESKAGTTLQSVTYTGVRRDLNTGNYTEKTLPPLLFKYTQPQVGKTFQSIVKETNENLPEGFNQPHTQITDLFGEGVPGILAETENTWYYKPNMGNGTFGRQEIVINKPSHQPGTYSLGDFDQNGNINLFSLEGRMAGYYEYDRNIEKWSGFKALQSIPQVGASMFMDVNANGLPDLVVEREDKMICYPFKGKEGFGKPYEFSKPLSNGVAYAPAIGEDLSLDYFLADMTGDGMPDQVSIKNGQVTYYPNLGNGRFGERVVMENAPVIDFETSFDAGRIRLYDLDGSGTTDIIYIGNGEIRYWYNASGNKFIEGDIITNLPYIDNISTANIFDFLGNGTPCLVWSNTLNHLQYSTVQYLELTNGIRPGLLTSLENSMGKEIRIEYGYSGDHYLQAKKSSDPWISKMPFHFTVVDKKVVEDHITNSRFITRYKYRDGHYKGDERAFITFGLVEQYDTELYENPSLTHDKDYARPSCLKTWFHNGSFGWDAKRAAQFYNKDPKQQLLTPQHFEQNEALEAKDFEKGYRSLGGQVIRRELFAASYDGIAEEHPYQVTQHAYGIRKLQPKTTKNDSCFFAYQTEAVSYTYEEQVNDPKISHNLSVAVDEYGDIEKELSISYARRSNIPDIHPAQNKDYITAGFHKFIHTDVLSKYQTGVLYESKDFEVNYLDHGPDKLLQLKDIQNIFDVLITNAIDYDQQLPAGGVSQARLISWDRTYFWNDVFNDVLPLGQTGTLLFAHHEESACFNDNTINQAFGGKVTQAMLSANNEGNYIQKDGYWWQHSPVNHFKDASGFFNLDHIEKAPGNNTQYTYDSYYLNITKINDPLGNVTMGEIDYNVIEPFKLIDQNDNISEVIYDPLGVVIAASRQGTVMDETNTLQKYGNELIASYTRRNDETPDNILATPQAYLQQANYFFFYDLDCWKDENKPLRSIGIARENLIHDGKGNIDNTSQYQLNITYQDGFGRTIQNKQKVEPGPAIKRLADNSIVLDTSGEPVLENTPERWLVSGHVVYNNKQQPIRQFEPFFSSLIEFENDEAIETYGVSAQNYYDAIGRIYKTVFPDSTFTEVRFFAWEFHSFDQNDTVDRSLYKTFREFLPDENPEKIALNKSLAHKDTPTIIKTDPLGREIITIEINNDNTERKIENKYDINGNTAEIIDARNLKAFEYKRDMLGRLLYEKSIDAGEAWSFHNNLDQTTHQWNSRNIHQQTRYDALNRVTTIYVDGVLGLNQVTERFVYGEDPSIPQAKERNLRGQPVSHYDQAGIQEIKLLTPGGLPLIANRKLLNQFTAEPNWGNPATVALDAREFISKYTYDALGRTLQQELPDNTIRKFVFNQGRGMQKILVSTTDGVLSDVEVLKNASYDAKGLRQQVLMGNNVAIKYTYDDQNFRLKKIHAAKTTGTARTYQDIRYTYDPVGNLVYSLDHTQQPDAANPKVISGLNVSAHSEFEYDARYQLKKAGGRVHQALLQHDYADRSRESGVPANWGKGTRHISLNNGTAVERYSRVYEYDVAGNIKNIKHTSASQQWARAIWTSPGSNRSLPLNDLNGTPVSNPESRFDENGNCIYMPNLRNIAWNYRNNIYKAVVIDRSAQGKPNDEEYYVYGGDGMRIRKITQRLTDIANETIELTEKTYLDGCEIKRITRGSTEILKCYTSHITDGTNTIARIHSWETDTQARETDNITQKRIHYQLGNHLGSASLELDENGDIITYEEYFPYGGSSFIAGRNKREINLKTYRYSGKERDDFTGLYYFGYRYYAHFIGGWLNPDPIGPEDSENLYLYVQNNPVNLTDPNGLNSKKRIKRSYTRPVKLPTEAAARKYWEGRIIKWDGKWIRVQIRSIKPGKKPGQWDIVINPIPVNQQGGSGKTQGSGGSGSTPGKGTGTSKQSGTGSGSTPGKGTGASKSGNKATGAAGEGADSNGKGNSKDTNGGGNHNGTGAGTKPQTNGAGNTGDGTGGTAKKGTGTGAGEKGSGKEGVGKGKDPSGTGTAKKGTGKGDGSGTKKGNKGNQGSGGKGSKGNGQVGGDPDGVAGGHIDGDPNGVLGGQLGGDPNGVSGGQLGGDSRGSLNGTLNGTQYRDKGSSNTAPPPGNVATGAVAQPGKGGAPGQGKPGEGKPAPNGQRGGGKGKQGQGQSGGQKTHWLDTASKWAGYLNLEFGDGKKGGGTGGIPGGMDLFGWRPPMWVRRTLQVVYIATTVILTVIPIGKAAVAAKVAIQGIAKAGLKATAKKLFTAIASKIPSRAAIKATLARVKGVVSLGLSKLARLKAAAISGLSRLASSARSLFSFRNKIIGTAQATGTRGHAFFSKLLAYRYALDPRVARVTLDLGYKRLLGGGAFRYGPRPDVGVLFRSGRVLIIEMGSKTDNLVQLIARNTNFMINNSINGRAVVYRWARWLNKIWPK